MYSFLFNSGSVLDLCKGILTSVIALAVASGIDVVEGSGNANYILNFVKKFLL